MLSITREFAASCTNTELHSLLHTLFNQLADQSLDQPARHRHHASIQAVRTELSHPAR